MILKTATVKIKKLRKELKFSWSHRPPSGQSLEKSTCCPETCDKTTRVSSRYSEHGGSYQKS